MKSSSGLFLLFFFWAGVAQPFSAPNIVMVDNFNEKKLVNQLGGNIGTWKRDPKDTSQWYEISFDDRNFVGKEGASLKVEYNIASYMTTYVYKENVVTSPEVGFHAQGFGGVYFQLKNLDISHLKYLIFSVKGDKKEGYTRKFKLEIKDKERTSSVFVDGISSTWRRFYIPLWQFDSKINLKEVQSIVIVFDQDVSLPKGVLYFDEIYFATDKISVEDYAVYQELLKPVKKEELVKMVAIPVETPTPTPEALMEIEKQDIQMAAQSAQLQVRREEDNVVVATHINFDTDQAVILESEIPKLATVASIIQKHPKFNIEIHGHTDSQGNENYNFHLSQRRAQAVKEYLIQAQGVDPYRLTPYGWGLRKPVDSNETPQGRAENRRVEFVFAPTTVVPVYRLEKPIRIDGILSEWPPFETLQLDDAVHLELGTVSSPEDLSANVSLQWDENFLYFAAQVFDQEIVCLKKGKNIFMSDGIELYIDPDGDDLVWGNPNDFQIGFAPTGPDNKSDMWAWFQNRKPTPEEIKFASHLNKDGYTVEAAISWKFLSNALAQKIKENKGTLQQDGLPLRFSVAVHDLDLKDGAHEAKLNWHFKKDSKVKDHFQLGSLLLIQQ